VANILLTDSCNRKCAYCFGAGKVSRSAEGPNAARTGKFMSRDDFRYVLDFLDRSKAEFVSLLGGEPTLHPEFHAIFADAVGTGKYIKLFTNGLMAPETAEMLAKSKGQLNVIVNVNEPDKTPAREWDWVNRTLAILGRRASISFNIYHPDCSFAFLPDLFLRHGLDKCLRVGISIPILGRNNEYLPLDQYRRVGGRLTEFSDICGQHDISIHMDCGFMMCMFTPMELGRHYVNGSDLHFHCDPIIDIGPDLQVWRCFPLSGCKNVNLKDFANRQQLVDYFNKEFQGVGNVGALPECLGCAQMRRGRCYGGCLAHAIHGFHAEKHFLAEADGGSL
jgi:cyclic pyranopterin phosphate synthase